MTGVLSSHLISTPGVYDIPAEQYHADPVVGGSLSSTGARTILRSPAKFRHDQTNPKPPTDAMELGLVVHEIVLGVGAGFVEVDASSWRTDVAKSRAKEIRADGKTPILRDDLAKAKAMAAELRNYPLAVALLTTGGVAEQVLVWRDEATGVMCRAMLDYLRGRLVVDYKTAADASRSGFAKAVANYGYHVQDAFYLDGVRALGLADDPDFVFVAQEKEPPYLVGIYRLGADDLAAGAERVARARERYRDCMESGIWPGYHLGEIEEITLPPWARRQHEEIISGY